MSSFFAVVVATLGVVGLAMAAMSVGVVLTGKRLKGSCGGVGGSCACKDAGVEPGSDPTICESAAGAGPG